MERQRFVREPCEVGRMRTGETGGTRRGIRVLQVSSFAPPHLGGLEKCAANLFRRLRSVGVEVRWLFSDVPHLSADEGTLRIKVWNGIERVLGIPVPIPAPRGVVTIWRAVREAEVVHIHDVLYLNCFLAVLSARVCGKPVVVTLHIWQVPYESRLVRAAQAFAHAMIGRACLRSASAIVAYSRQVLARAQDFGQARIAFVPNGVADEFVDRKEELSAQMQQARRIALGLPLEKRVVVFAGRFVEKKGLSPMRQLAGALPQVVFVFCGSGPIDPQRWGLENVVVLGQKSPAELRNVFEAGDLLALPSVGEGFPLVVQEAMACGLPCLVHRETWLAWGEGEGFFVIVDGREVEATVRNYLEAPFAFAVRAQIADYARRSWDWEKAVDNYGRLYEMVVRERSSQ